MGEALRAASLGLLVFGLSLSCLTLIRHTGRATPVWPANAIVLACLLRTEARLWPSWFFAAFAGNIAADLAAGDPIANAIGLGVANAFEIALAAGGLRRLVGRQIDLTRRLDLMAFGGVACFGAPLLSAIAAWVWLRIPLSRESLAGIGVWALADALGTAILGPVLLTLSFRDLHALWAPGSAARGLFILTALTVAMACIFGQSRVPMGILVIPMLLLVTFQLELAGALLGLLITAVICLGCALMGHGPTTYVFAAPSKAILALQVFLATMTFCILPIAAALARARPLKASLAASLEAAEAARAEGLEAQRAARMAQQIAGIGYFRLASDGIGSRWSDEVYRIHGVDPAYGPLNATIDAVHPDDRALVAEGLRAAREEVKPFSGQYRVQRSDGAWRTVSCRTVSEIGPDGQVAAVVGALVDVSEFKEIEAAAVENEARYRLLADKSSDVISRVDADGRLTYISPACLPMLGFTPEELVGRLAVDYVHADDQAPLYQAYERQADEGREHAAQPVRYRFQPKTGDWIWLETHPTAIFDDQGVLVEFISVSRNVTQAKAAEANLTAAREAAEAAAQAKSEFLANMSHEIRTPLTSIMGFSGLLKEVGELPENARLYVERISTAGQSLLAVVNDILDFSKLEAGQVELDPQPFDPAAFIAETTQLLAVQAANKGLDWRSHVDGPLPGHVLADSARLRQVLLNLLGNAIKFTAQGSVLGRIAYDAAGEGALKISVADTGEGIPAERRDRLFQRFSQVDGSVSRIHGGTGLGLAICKSLVELMGGQIGVNSEEGRGSTFWFTIAAPAVAAAAPTVGDAPELTLEVDEAGGARILVVDDLAVNRELVRAMLGPFGHDFEEAANGAEAVQAALRTGFDLILMDLQMPGMDGFEAARAIRATAPLNRTTPIIALSANVLPAHVIACHEAGMDDHLGKPIALTALVTKVAMWAGEQHLVIPGVAASLGI